MNRRQERPANLGTARGSPLSNSRGVDRRRLLGFAAVAFVLFNYPFLYVVERLLPLPSTFLVLFGAWAIVIAMLVLILGPRPS